MPQTQIIEYLVDFALPKSCLNCGEKLYDLKAMLCPNCAPTLAKLDDSYTNNGQISILNLYKFENDKPIQKLLHSMKYEKMKSIGRTLGRELGNEIKTRVNTQFDLIVPVPLHISKRRERTYNQSDYICKGIADILNIPVKTNLLKRIRFTESQTKLHVDERQANVKDAFILNLKFKELIAGKNIILADDVITTGATIMECANVLVKNGCGSILVSSVAIA